MTRCGPCCRTTTTTWRGVAAAQVVAAAVLAESGVAGLAEMTVELSLRLASALERIAGDQGLVAVDLADVWFMD